MGRAKAGGTDAESVEERPRPTTTTLRQELSQESLGEQEVKVSSPRPKKVRPVRQGHAAGRENRGGKA